MAAPSKAYVTINDSQVDADSPGDTILMTGIRDNLVHLQECIYDPAVHTAAKAHTHNGPDSAPAVVPDGSITNYKFANFVVGDDLLFSNDIERTKFQGTTPIMCKETTATRDGNLRIKYDGYMISNQGYSNIYINGTPVGTQRTLTGSYVTYSEDIAVSAGDLVQVYVWSNSAGGSNVYIRNFRFYYTAWVEFVATAGA